MTQYLYYNRIREHGGMVEVGIYDPNRWDGEGGMNFGLTAEVHLDDAWFHTRQPGTWRVQVSWGSTGAGPIAEMEQKMDVYQQAIDIAKAIQEALDNDVPLLDIKAMLDERLGEGPRTERFVFEAAS